MAEAGAVRATVLLCATPPRGVLATSPTLIGRQLKRWCHRRGFNATATSACSRGRLLPGRLAGEVECLQLAGLRPSSPTVATSPARLHFSLLRDLQRVVDLDPEVSDCAFQLGVSTQELNRPKIPGAPVDQRRLGASQRMGAVGCGIEPNRPRPGAN